MLKIYEIGGSVRDKLLGLDSKDKDFVVVLDNINISCDEGFNIMKTHLLNENYTIFLETKDCYTLRAKFPESHKYKNMTCDFVLARKELGYIENTRKPNLVLGTIQDDVFRRDFCCNSLYIDETEYIIDLTGYGISDIENKILRTPLDTSKTIQDDPLRIFRAIRFAITKEFKLHFELKNSILDDDYNFNTISIERVREELYKCFKKNTLKTLEYLELFPKIKDYAFENNLLWLKPTTELK